MLGGGGGASTSSSRTVSLPASSCSASHSSTPQPVAMSSSHPRSSIGGSSSGSNGAAVCIQRQPNVQSSTETLCSESDVNEKSRKLSKTTKTRGIETGVGGGASVRSSNMISQYATSSKTPALQHEQLGALACGRPTAGMVHQQYHHHQNCQLHCHHSPKSGEEDDDEEIERIISANHLQNTSANVQSSRYLMSNGY